jgi:hypothetical protein
VRLFGAVTFEFSVITTDIYIYVFHYFFTRTLLDPLYTFGIFSISKMILGFFVVVFGLFVFQCGKITDADDPLDDRQRVPSESSSSPCSSPGDSDEEEGYTPVKIN